MKYFFIITLLLSSSSSFGNTVSKNVFCEFKEKVGERSQSWINHGIPIFSERGEAEYHLSQVDAPDDMRLRIVIRLYVDGYENKSNFDPVLDIRVHTLSGKFLSEQIFHPAREGVKLVFTSKIEPEYNRSHEISCWVH